MKKILGPIFAGIWITISEFLRNQILFISFWENHYRTLGLKFNTLPINGIFWIIWSFLFAFIIDTLLNKYSIFKTILLSWFAGFVMMWITVYNLQVLPIKLLLIAIPLSIIEIAVAVILIRTLSKKK
jgi:hypothetical protein